VSETKIKRCFEQGNATAQPKDEDLHEKPWKMSVFLSERSALNGQPMGRDEPEHVFLVPCFALIFWSKETWPERSAANKLKEWHESDISCCPLILLWHATTHRKTRSSCTTTMKTRALTPCWEDCTQRQVVFHKLLVSSLSSSSSSSGVMRLAHKRECCACIASSSVVSVRSLVRVFVG
jgi:hypothetical protein